MGNWIASLDNIERQGSEPQINVYKVRNGNAAQLAGLLSTIYGGSGGISGGAQRQGVAPGMKQAGVGGTGSMEAGIVRWAPSREARSGSVAVSLSSRMVCGWWQMTTTIHFGAGNAL